jgi:aspartate kinase
VQVVHDGFRLHEPQQSHPKVGYQSRDKHKDSHEAREELEREVVANLQAMEDIVVSEVELDSHQSRVTLTNLPDVPGVAAAIFTAVAEGGIMVDMIVQNISHSGHASLSFTVPRVDLDQCLLLTREVLEEWENVSLSFDRDIAKLSISGIGLRSHTGVGEKAFRALSEAGINVQLINTSEVRMSAIVAADLGKKALNALLEAFHLVAP